MVHRKVKYHFTSKSINASTLSGKTSDKVWLVSVELGWAGLAWGGLGLGYARQGLGWAEARPMLGLG